MPRLAEAQAALRDAIVAGDRNAVMPMLTSGARGGNPAHRLSIHQRHYEASLTELIAKRFPALNWLVGEAYLAAAALAYARARPPRRPALDAYGGDFPAFLTQRPGAEGMPWLADVGALEWRLAEVAATIERTPLAIDRIADFEAVPLEELHLQLQPGAIYWMSAWPVDELVRVFLEGNAPPQLTFEPMPILLELRGARGAYAIRRLDGGTFAFREALASGAPVAAALSGGEGAAPGFDAGAAFAALFADGLVTGIGAGPAPL